MSDNALGYIAMAVIALGVIVIGSINNHDVKRCVANGHDVDHCLSILNP